MSLLGQRLAIYRARKDCRLSATLRVILPDELADELTDENFVAALPGRAIPDAGAATE